MRLRNADFHLAVSLLTKVVKVLVMPVVQYACETCKKQFKTLKRAAACEREHMLIQPCPDGDRRTAIQ